MGVEEHEAWTFLYYKLTKRSDIIVKDRFFCALFRKSCLLQRFCFFVSINDHHDDRSRRLVRKRWEGVFATREWIDSHHLGDVRVQSPGVCTQSVMSTVNIRSNLMGCQRTDHGCTKWCRRGDRKSADRTRRSLTFEYTWYYSTHMVSTVSTRRALPFWIIPVRPMTPTWFWGSKTGPTETTLADGREWKYIHNMSISQSNSWLLCSILLLPVSLPLWSALFRYKWWIVWTKGGLYIQCISAHFNPAKVCGSVLVWNTCTTSIFLRRLHRSKYEQPIRWMDYWWYVKERALKTYTVFWHASCISEISICMRLKYIVQHSALNPPQTVLYRWSTMDGERWQFDGTLQMVPHLHSMGGPFPRTLKWAMPKDLWIGISGNFH